MKNKQFIRVQGNWAEKRKENKPVEQMQIGLDQTTFDVDIV